MIYMAPAASFLSAVRIMKLLRGFNDYIDINKLLREALAASQSNETILNMIDEMMRETTRESELEEYVRKKAELLV